MGGFNVIAIVPAREGSKGLPGKNIKLLAGKPMIAYTIEAALQSKNINRVIISTDSEEIADIAIKHGAEVPFLRPVELATDTAHAIDAYLYTIEQLEKEEKVNIEHIVVLLPTSPLRTSEDIDSAITMFYNKNADSVISYTQEKHPVHWHKYIREDGKFDNIFEQTLQNRQDYRPTYYPNGSIYIFNVSILKQRTYYTSNSFGYIMPNIRSIDIDTELDFIIAETMINRKTSK